MPSSDLTDRIDGVCEFCGASGDLERTAQPPGEAVLLCSVCRGQSEPDSPAHWQCLQGAAWSTEPAVQFAVWRRLGALEDLWATELRETMILSDEARAWADTPEALVHRDAHGARLEQGDTVVLIKDLPVKGAGFTAKRGTAVRGISLVTDNAAQIEGRVEGQRIVILTAFVKKK
ncbi:MAG: PhnA domain-containing protein [Rhodobacteraceae bacterium]|jgi:protein PhnA|nr:PhnA domain-containing protein [Paracoccaceae bacterium]